MVVVVVWVVVVVVVVEMVVWVVVGYTSVPRRARMQGSWTFVSLNSSLENSQAEEEECTSSKVSAYFLGKKINIFIFRGGKSI